MPAEKQDRNAVFTEEEEDDDSLDEDEDHSTLQQSQLNDDEDEELEEEEDLNSPSHSFSDDYEDDENPKNPNSNPSLRYKSVGSVPVPPPSNGSAVPLPKPPPPPPPVKTEPLSPKRERATADDEKKPSAAMDDSRRLFQRLWTDEDEIGLLQGFLDYSSHRSQTNSFASHHDTSQFYDQVKDRLQLDFNKSQLVEKLRRLKKKYRNVLSRIGSGKDFSFKSPHDQATFEISRKIWSTPSAGTFDDDDGNQQNGNLKVLNNSDRKVPIPTPRKRSRKTPATATEANVSTPPPLSPTKTSSANPNPSPNVIEDTVRSCLSPLFKELLYCAVNGQSNSGITGGMSLNPLPLNFGGNSANLGSSEGMSEKWRRQQILELEVYSKRLELVQEQINSALENLKSMGGQ